MGVSVLCLVGRTVYYPDMASIVGKKRGNKTYYYLVTSARVDGKPRIVDQQYLGSAEEVMARLSGAPSTRGSATSRRSGGSWRASGSWRPSTPCVDRARRRPARTTHRIDGLPDPGAPQDPPERRQVA